MTRNTPELISALQPGEVFVFGSNKAGAHAGGAARFAVERFGAVWGVGEGHQGQAYAIPTMDGFEVLEDAVERFLVFADKHAELTFLVTPIGTGIAGLPAEPIARLFVACPWNVILPASFEALGAWVHGRKTMFRRDEVDA